MFDALRRRLPARWKRPLKRWLGRPETRLHPDWEILRRIGPVSEPHFVIDVGAHHGWFFHCWRDWCPSAEVHAFEPTPASRARAAEFYGGAPGIFVTQAAVGARRGTARLKVLADSSVSNSLLEPDAGRWREIAYSTGEVSEIEVPVVTLDDYAAERGLGEVKLLKIDVQGFELEVLRGAEALLPRVENVFVESAIEPLYLGAARFTEVFDFLTVRGFRLIGFRSWHRGNYALVEADLLFRRAERVGPVDMTFDRIYEGS